jgi:hypothetical protein
VAITPSMAITGVQRVWPSLPAINANSARLPPSPLLSARIMTKTYLIVTTSSIVQKISDSTPKTCA